MPHAYTESQIFEQPAIGLIAALGWQTVSAINETTLGAGSTLGCETKREVVLVAHFALRSAESRRIMRANNRLQRPVRCAVTVEPER